MKDEFGSGCCFILHPFAFSLRGAAVAQLVERFLGKDEVLGSNPSSSFCESCFFDPGPAPRGAAVFALAEERWLRTYLRGPSRMSTWARSVTSITARPH